MYVLDTNTLIYFFKGIGKVAEKLLSIPPKNIGLPSIVLYEILVGIAKSISPEKRTFQLEQLATTVNILPFGRKEAGYAAKIRAGLETKGQPIGPYDVLIAATAISNNGILVTHNLNEFQRVDGLRIEDWY
jgi:tRNA(fMet)-specific endonuclease VapC